MSGETSGSGTRSAAGTARRVAPLLAVLVLALVAAALAGPADEGLPLDPRSAGPSGTRALVDSLTELGVDVEVDADVPGSGTGRALLLIDDLDADETDALLRWVEAGGVLVVADPRSTLAPEIVGSTGIGGFGVLPLTPDCDVPGLAEVSEVLPMQTGVVYDLPAGATGCFPRDDGHWMVVDPRGQGGIVAIGGQDVLINLRLGDAGHPELLAALLAPAGGSVAVLRTRRPGEGDAVLTDLIGRNVSLFALQLLVALLLAIAWRARRLGRPVEEPQPVAIPGSELVTAVGNLWQDADARGRAALVLQAELRRTLEQRLGLPRGSAPADLAAAAASRSGVDGEALATALTARIPDDPAALVALAHDLERLRSEALGPPVATARRDL